MSSQSENIELRLLLEGVFLRYGYDFRGYAQASLKRRVLKIMSAEELTTISELQHRVLDDEQFFEKLLLALTVNVTEMFRDPDMFVALTTWVFPELAKRPFIKIWHAGCATGEEVYSVAIMLQEAGLLDRCRIFATDIDATVLDKARAGIYPIDRMREWTANYQLACGKHSFSDYYTAQYGAAIIDASLKRNIVFADHNLAVDGPFGEMDLIICRNVIIYFGRDLQSRVLELFAASLVDRGMLCLGNRETIRFAACADLFEELGPGLRIYRKHPAEHP